MLHYEIGMRIGERSLPPAFDGVLIWVALKYAQEKAGPRWGRLFSSWRPARVYFASGYQGKGPIQRSVISLSVFISSHSS